MESSPVSDQYFKLYSLLNLFRFHFPSCGLAVILWACRKFLSLRQDRTVDSVYAAEDYQGLEVK